MSSIERHPKRKAWRVRWRVGGRGTPQKSSEWFDSKDDAEKAQMQVDGRKRAAKPAAGQTLMTMPEIISRWATKRNGKRSERYLAEAADRLLDLCREKEWTRASDVTDTESLGVGVFRNLRVVLRFAHLHFGQPLPPLIPPDATKRRVEVDLLTPERIEELIALAREWCHGAADIAHIVATYGHRPQSLVQLKVSALGTSKLTLRVKSGDDVAHPLMAETVKMLRAHAKGRKPTDWLFLGPEGEPWADGHAYSQWFFHRIGDHQLGIYQLKRYALTRMIGAGLDVATIASITGHRHPQTILRYARTNQDRQKLAIKALEGLGAPGVPPPSRPK